VSRMVGHSWRARFCVAVAVFSLSTPVDLVGAVDVLTNRHDNGRTGANTRENRLKVANVNSERFGKLFEREVDGDVYAQPLIKTGVRIPGVGRRNVVFVATTSNSLYAFDADRPDVTRAYWRNGREVFGAPVERNEVGNAIYPDEYQNFEHSIGIVSTPVIDQKKDTIYVVAKSKTESGAYRHRLHAFDVSTGREKTELGSPATIDAEGMDHRKLLNRAGLLLHDGSLYVAFGAHGDDEPNFDYHGWILAYGSRDLRLISAFCTTPDGKQGGVWQSGAGLSAESRRGRKSLVYAVVGNGDNGGNNFGQSVLQLRAAPSLTLNQVFVPDGASEMNELDLDLSTGALLVPGTPLLVACSKAGACYVVNRSSMQLLQEFRAASNGMEPDRYTNVHGTPVAWREKGRQLSLYVWGEEDYLRAYRLSRDGFVLADSSLFPAPPRSMPGGILAISSNKNKRGTGIVWASVPRDADANNATVEGVLRAFDASDLSRELWNSAMIVERDRLGMFAKFCPPVVANGKVYMATFAPPQSPNGAEMSPRSARLVVYGMLSGSGTSPQK
jgi:hypothetical protein